MNFLIPAAFGLALFLPLIIAMYLLKLRRTEQRVSSTYLWQRMVRDVEANAPWQRLRRNLLLFLQLLIMALLTLALSRPFTWSSAPAGQTVVFVVDTSASMAATDAPPTRLGGAQAQMRSIVDGLDARARVTLIAAGRSPQVLVAASQDRRQIQRGIDGLAPEPGSANLTAALELATAVAARQPDATIQLFSDFAGVGDLPDRFQENAAISFVSMGQSSNNQAIAALTLQPADAGLSAFVQVANYGAEPATRRLVISVDASEEAGADGSRQIVNAYDLEIAPEGQQSVVVDGLPLETEVVHAELTGQDLLSLDDRAWAVAPQGVPTPVMLVSRGNRFLETALALLPNLAVTVLRPADFEEYTGDGQTATRPPLTIFDAYTPITATLPPGNLLFIAPPRSTDFFTVTGSLAQPLPAVVETAAPLLADVDLADVHILRAVHLAAPAWAHVELADGTNESGAPLLMRGEIDGRRVAVLTFDLRDSDLPLQVAFPVLLANLADWLTLGATGAIPTEVVPGEPLLFSPPPGVEQVTIVRPDGSTLQMQPAAGRVRFVDTHELGVYGVAWNEEVAAQVAVNLYAPQESALRPGEPFAAAAIRDDGTGRAVQPARREWWRLLALAALIVLMVEWLVYQRGTVARLVADSTMRRNFLHGGRES